MPLVRFDQGRQGWASCQVALLAVRLGFEWVCIGAGGCFLYLFQGPAPRFLFPCVLLQSQGLGPCGPHVPLVGERHTLRPL